MPLSGLFSAWRRQRDARTLQRRPIPDELWQAVVMRYPFLARRGEAELQALRELSTLFLARKEFSGAGGLEVSDEIALAITVQACLPVLRLGLHHYDGFLGIVVHPDEVVAEREVTDEDGVVHQYDETLSGEAMDGGPVMLCWRDVAEAGESAAWGYNVVVHEFAHVLDMRNGTANGMPPLVDEALRERWPRVMGSEYRRFCRHVDLGHETLLDPYGAESEAEFFAVASEHFFVTPDDLAARHRPLYALLAEYYRQDPAGIGLPGT